MSPDATGYIYLNVGPAVASSPSATGYIYLNVGAGATSSPSAIGYVYLDVLPAPVFIGWGVPI